MRNFWQLFYCSCLTGLKIPFPEWLAHHFSDETSVTKMLLRILLKLQINSKNKCICLINNLEGYNKKDFDIQTQINHEQK